MTESPDARLKRLKIRAWRRGTKEMDLILGPYADANLARMDAAQITAFDALLEEADTDLLPWILGQTDPPAAHADLLGTIATFARTRFG